MRFLNVEMVRAIHSDLIRNYGGSHGLRDAGLLESALMKPRHLETYEPMAGIGRLAAVLGWGLVKNHAFLDGNKRIALAAMVTFLKLNGHQLACSEAEETTMLLRAAAGEISEAEWMEWVERSVGAIG